VKIERKKENREIERNGNLGKTEKMKENYEKERERERNKKGEVSGKEKEI
jgi:hypothetical protein